MAVCGSGVLATRCVPEIRRGVVGGFVGDALVGDEGVGRLGGCISTGRIRLADGPAPAGGTGWFPIAGLEEGAGWLAGGTPGMETGGVPGLPGAPVI